MVLEVEVRVMASNGKISGADRRSEDKPLVVDLDGTLIRSDLLHETFWSAFAHDLLIPARAVGALGSGRAALKQMLVDKSKVDLSTLPFDTEVIAYINAWRQQGGRVVLVTASDHRLAEGVAAHLGIFDEAHGTTGDTNLKGRAKAQFLVDRYGENGFHYIGDAKADLPVWETADKAITVNAKSSLRHQAEGLGKPVQHLQTLEETWKPYVQALRPHQWLKNMLVFLPMLADHRLDAETFTLSLLAFVAFSLVASSVYLFNDLLDLRADRAHPRKSKRPIAAGLLPIAQASVMAVGAAMIGAGLSVFIGWQFFLIMSGYYALTVAYSLFLKRRPVIDICVLAGLYTMRIIAGSVATNIDLTVWLLAFSLFLFFSLAAIKRQAELVDMNKRGELSAAGRGYHADDLPIVSSIAVSAGFLSVLVLALYINSPGVVELYSQPVLLWGVCCVLLYWITRMVMVAHRGSMNDDPIIFAVKDRVSQACIVMSGAIVVAGALL
jgi:4-hydroxybenzoate polyprenyltransferase/phosphoserine phosphatase